MTAFALAIATPPGGAQAADVAGVAFEPAAQVAGETLQLNGAGLRKRFFVEVYAAGLYVPQRTSSAPALLAQEGPRRVVIAMLRDVGADQFSVAISDGLAANHTAAQLTALVRQIDALQANLAAIGEPARRPVPLRYTPSAGTRTW